MVTICCVCHKTKTEKGWEFRPQPETESLSHGYCPVCAEKTLAELRECQAMLVAAAV